MKTQDMQIRVCAQDDADSLALIGQATFLDTFAGILPGNAILGHCQTVHGLSCYQAWLQDAAYRLWLTEVYPGAAPVAYMMVAPAQLPLADLSAHDLELKRIYILGRFQEMGLGKRLLSQAVDYARQQGAKRLLLGVYQQNLAAIGFYQHMGFVQVGVRQFNVGGQWYDDYVMGLTL